MDEANIRITPTQPVLCGRIRAAYAEHVRTLGQNIRDARLAAKLTQDQVAAKLAIKGNGTVSKWETGKQRPTSDQLGPLAALLGVTVDALFVGVEPTRARKARDLSGHTPAADSSLTEGGAVQSSLQTLAGPFHDAPQPNPPADPDGVTPHGTDSRTAIAQVIAAIDTRFTTFDALLKRFAVAHVELTDTVAHIEAIAKDFNQQAAKLAVAANSARRAAARALGAGSAPAAGKSVGEARGTGHRKAGGAKPSRGKG